MRLEALLNLWHRWLRRMVAWMFSMATSGYRIRLDFPDGQKAVLGPVSGPIQVAVCPPTFLRTIWIFLSPGLRVGESYVQGHWSITQGDLATFMRIIQVPRTGIYARFYALFSDFRGPIFFVRQRAFAAWNRRRGSKHYDAGNELYRHMLDSSEQYSCAFF